MRLLTLLKTRRIPFQRTAGSAEIILECPQCARLGLRTDNSRFFFNVQKHVGHCWRCGWGGSEKDLLDLLRIRATSPLEADLDRLDQPRRRRPVTVSRLPEGVIPAYQHRRARHYLESRQLTKSTMQKFALLYCPDGYYRDRIIIPVCDRQGNYRTFVARAIDSSAPKKYLFPRGSSVSRLVYNLHFVRRSAVWLTEGVFDAIHCYPYGVATFGKHISDFQMMLLRLHHVTTVYLLWDAEAWEETPDLWQQAVRRLKSWFFVYQVKLPADTPTEYALTSLKGLCRQTRRKAL